MDEAVTDRQPDELGDGAVPDADIATDENDEDDGVSK